MSNPTYLVCLIAAFVFPCFDTVRITGEWSSHQMATVLVKFGFQKIDSLNLEHTRGFIYGNITDKHEFNRAHKSPGHLDKNQTLFAHTNDRRLLLALITQSKFAKFYELIRSSDLQDGASCSNLLSGLSSVAFEARCLWNGTEDYLRTVPCASGHICTEEDVPSNVIPNHQFTFRIQEKVMPGFWLVCFRLFSVFEYVALLSCCLNEDCNWQSQSSAVSVDYDIWLVNGSPFVKYLNPFEHQFSFDEQDTAEIYMSALVLFVCLLCLQIRAIHLLQHDQHSFTLKHVPARYKILLVVISMQVLSALCSCVHIVVYSVNGTGLLPIRWVGDLLTICAMNTLTFLVLLFAMGWSLVSSDVANKHRVIALMLTVTSLHLIFFVANSQTVDSLEEIDIYNTWPGCAILLFREEEPKAEFLTHFGAAYLMWLVYKPLLALLASQMSWLWRFKLLLGISYTADVLADALLVHLLWPRSTNRKFFLPDAAFNEPQINQFPMRSQFARFSPVENRALELDDEIDEYEKELLNPDKDTECEPVPMDPVSQLL